jgi:hypothetical protein
MCRLSVPLLKKATLERMQICLNFPGPLMLTPVLANERKRCMPMISLILDRTYSAQTPKSMLYTRSLSLSLQTRLVRRRTLRVEEDGALFDLNVFLAVACIIDTIIAFLLRDNLDFDTIDASGQFRFKHRLALLLAELVAGTRAVAIDASGYGDAVDFERLVAIDGDEYAIQTSR